MIKQSHYQLFAVFVFILTVSMSPSLIAAENLTGSSSSEDQLSNEQLNDLIIVLESDTARQEFLSNLKTLIKADEENSESSFSISETLDIDNTSSSLLQSYYDFISRWGISDSIGGGLIVIAAVILIISLICLINNAVANRFDRNLAGVRTRMGWSEDRFRLLFKGQKLAGYAVGLVLLANALVYVFGDQRMFSQESSLALEISGFVLISLIICLFVVLAWEGINAALEYGSHESSSLNSTRMKTLMPVVRNLAFFFILLLSSLVILSELGIDIVPLLAGAGVLGIAIGFGAQTMVKDFLTGFIIVLEDLIQVGDVIGIGGRTGSVEKITLRKVQIRNLDGTVHTVPHSEISVVDNLTKEYSYYLMNIGVAYSADTDEVIDCIEAVDEEIRADSEFEGKVLEPIEVLGVDEFADSAVMIKVRTKTRAHDKWKVGREFNRRIKKHFDEKNIEIPFPHRTLYFANDPGNQMDQSSDSQEEAVSDS